MRLKLLMEQVLSSHFPNLCFSLLLPGEAHHEIVSRYHEIVSRCCCRVRLTMSRMPYKEGVEDPYKEGDPAG